MSVKTYEDESISWNRQRHLSKTHYLHCLQESPIPPKTNIGIEQIVNRSTYPEISLIVLTSGKSRTVQPDIPKTVYDPSVHPLPLMSPIIRKIFCFSADALPVQLLSSSFLNLLLARLKYPDETNSMAIRSLNIFQAIEVFYFLSACIH